MELSDETKSSLILINNPNNITDECLKKLLDNAFAALLNKPEIHSKNQLTTALKQENI